MTLSNQEKQLITDSFTLLSSQETPFAEYFYQCLFTLAPLVKPMFKSDRKIIEKHFLQLVTNVVENIDDADKITPMLIQLGKQHRTYQVKVGQFPVVKSALILSIEYQLREKMTREIKQAWENYYDIIAEIMIKGLESTDE